MNPRLLLLAHGYHDRAGVEEHLKALAHGLRDLYQIWVAFPQQDSLHLVHPDGSETGYAADPPSFPLAPFRAGRTEAAVEEILRAASPHLIHVQHMMKWPLSTLPQVLASGKPVVMSFHDFYVATPSYMLTTDGLPPDTVSSAFSQRYFGADISAYLGQRRQVLQRCLSRAARLIVPSEYLGEQLISVFPYRFQVIPCGIEPFETPPRSPSPSVRFGYVGGWLPHKGWQVLLRAFIELRRRRSDVELAFFGTGDPQPIQVEGVAFHGAYDRSQLPEVLSQFDVGVIPSIFTETFSQVLSEMWMANLPVVASDLGALRRRVQDGINGRLFAASDVDALLRALEWFAQNDSWRSWRVPQPDLLESMLASYHQVYSEVLNLAESCS